MNYECKYQNSLLKPTRTINVSTHIKWKREKNAGQSALPSPFECGVKRNAQGLSNSRLDSIVCDKVFPDVKSIN